MPCRSPPIRNEQADEAVPGAELHDRSAAPPRQRARGAAGFFLDANVCTYTYIGKQIMGDGQWGIVQRV